LQGIFETTALSGIELAVSVSVSLLVFVAVELEKWWRRQRGQKG
jgi:hypothetical protein